MKKVLFTTTALVAFAGAASAEVTLSGYAEMGIIGSSGDETRFHNDIDVKFSLSGETDSGLSFGATIDLDEVGGGFDHNGNKSSVWISGGFGKLTLGDTDGALDWAMQEVGIGSALTDDHTTHAGFNFNSGADGTYDGQVLRYDNTFGDFGVAVSAELDDSGVGDVAWGLGLKYNAALGGVDLGLGLGFQDDGTSTIIGLSVDAKFGSGFRAILNYSDLDGKAMGGTSAVNGTINPVTGVFTAGTAAIAGDAMDSHLGLGLGYTTGALTVSANYGVYSAVAANSDHTGYGLAVNYDLGGGAVVMAGYGHSKVDAGSANANTGSSTWSIGLGLSF